jgi:putative heme-binding domain-containing protein
VFETLVHGTTNPWGHDWNEYGEGFFINTVNGHLWHLIPGAHFKRPHTIEPNPWVFDPIDFHADHYHFDTGKGWNKVGADSPESDALGGGHAHIGCLIYQDNNWPLAYRGKLLTANMHGRRVNVERLEREGSGYVARHEPDMLKTRDPWFRGMELTSGPDGGVFLLDWSDTGECHDHTGVHRESGRIYKVTYSAPGLALKADEADLTKRPLRELFELALEADGWFGRMAHRELVARKAAGESLNAELSLIRESLAALTAPDADLDLTIPANVRATLRAMWLLHDLADPEAIPRRDPEAQAPDVVGNGKTGDDRKDQDVTFEAAFDWLSLFDLADERIAAWSIRLAVDAYPIDTIFGDRPALPAGQFDMPLEVADDLGALIGVNPSGLMRLAFASAMLRMPHEARATAAISLLTHVEDARDHNLPSLVWTALHPLAEEFPEDLQHVAAAGTWSALNRSILRRFASEYDEYRSYINQLLANAVRDRDPAFAADLVMGLSQGLAGRRQAIRPVDWDELLARFEPGAGPEFAQALRDLSVVFGDGRALAEVTRAALDDKLGIDQRKSALQTLIDVQAADLREVCEKLLSVRHLNTTALAGLATLSDPAVGERLAKSYRSFHASDRPAVIETLVSRAVFAKPLLEELANGRIPKSDLTTSHARQILRLNSDELTARLREVWGDVRDSSAEKQALVAALKAQVSAEKLAEADKGKGRSLFNRHCASCHQLYGHGAKVGPDLTGADRKNLDYLVENIADPSASLAADFRMTVFELKDGRVVSGVVMSRTPQAISVRTQKELLTIAPDDVEESQPTTLSLMPEGLLDSLSEVERRDLFGYLMHPVQVPARD